MDLNKNIKITEHKALLETIAKELNGKLSYWHCIDKYTEQHKIVIEYGLTRKN